MEKIAKHIETLLRRHDYVILPDFGGFVLQYQSARVHEDFIAPPFASVGFNPLMNVSDGLLAIEMSRMDGKSFRESVQLMEEEITLVKQQLKKGQTVVLGVLGVLKLNLDDKIEFTPSDNKMLFPSNYGMSPLYYAKISALPEQKKTVTISMPSQRKITRYIAIGFVATGLMFVAPTLNDMRNNTASLNPLRSFEVNVESSHAAVQQVKPENNLMIVSEETPKTSSVQTVEKRYHVIVGCLATQKMAEQLCDELKSKNYSHAHILPPIKTYRVAVESFDTENDAVAFMRNIRNTHAEYSEAWVLNF